ncbi:hypothetical protein [Amycolatopsis suaedae]|uniref:Uncharacterized protein n=1 Tax=Amycolatopsis suaedae TaxID=2510978 RepID=A0A4Q7J2R5_9PSEU|nr:hypothetical protein [Amycolatopsis suaedae]RZQ61750.1 hypothetical protein EWH70_22635 [Amycolatopsis suaedae]
MLWLLGEIWIWLLVAFALGCGLTGLLLTRIHRGRVAELERERDEAAAPALAAGGAVALEAYPEHDEDYDEAPADHPMSAEEHTQLFPAASAAGWDDNGHEPAEPVATFPAEDPDEPVAEHTGTVDWPDEYAEPGVPQAVDDPGATPEWPREEDWPPAEHHRGGW